jgi:hypothetical protein
MFYRNVCLNDFDFISLSETWLLPNIKTAELGLDNYNTYRYDRNSQTNDCSRGGGVLIAINNKYYSRMLPLPPCSVQHLFVIVKINFVYYILGNTYFPPSSPITLCNIHFDIINDLLISYPYVKHVILVGNYNTPNLKWQFTSPSCSPNYLNLNQLSVNFLSKI